MRIDRLVSAVMFVSRKDAKFYIRNRRVTVNDVTVKNENSQVNLSKDIVKIDNEIVVYREYYYYLLNKPSGFVCAREDNVNKTVFDYLTNLKHLDLHTVGRLDKDTTGVLLLTNNGKLTHDLISPKKSIEKTYVVTVDKTLDHKLIDAFKNGVNINNEYTTLPAEIVFTNENEAEVTVVEGKYHQIKRMFLAFGYTVINLHRKSFYFLTDADLQIGEYRELTSEEEKELFK